MEVINRETQGRGGLILVPVARGTWFNHVFVADKQVIPSGLNSYIRTE